MISSPAHEVPAWALRLPKREASTVAALRLCQGIEVADDAMAGNLWLRGRSADDSVTAVLRGLPATERFVWLPDGRLQSHGAVMAVARFPAVEWQPLQVWLEFALPVARLAAAEPAPGSIRLVPSHEARLANATLTPLEGFLDWMIDAPAVRLARLRFAASSDGRCLVLGSPVPTLPGRPCCEDTGVVIPAGLGWTPAVSASVVRRLLRASAEAVVWWDESGARVLGSELFVQASRGAARATRASLDSGAFP